MAERLSDDERSTLNKGRIDSALAAIINTPPTELDGDSAFAELDAALTPGNSRVPLAALSPPIRSGPSSADIHAGIGDVDDSESADDDGQLLPTFDDLNTSPHEADVHPSIPAPGAPAPSPRTARRPDFDTTLIDLLNQRRPTDHSAPSAAAFDEQPAVIPASIPPVSARAEEQRTPVLSSGDNPPVIPPPYDEGSPSPRVPLRSDSAAQSASIASTGKNVASAGTDWFRKQRGIVKFLVVGSAVVIVLLSITSLVGKENEPATQTSATQSQAPPPPPVPATSDGTLIPTSVNATCPDGSTSPNFAFSAEQSEAWICARAFGIDGTVLEMTWKRPIVVTSVTIVPGFNYVEPSGLDRWTEYRVVTRVRWRVGDQQFIQNIDPTRTGATFQIPTVAAQRISMTILETQEPTGGADSGPGSVLGNDKNADAFAVSKIQITGHEA